MCINTVFVYDHGEILAELSKEYFALAQSAELWLYTAHFGKCIRPFGHFTHPLEMKSYGSPFHAYPLTRTFFPPLT